ncbi:MAG: tRNA uridine-5-carboxymethylaminomethyl(34) synthesis GTPase MnmE [bacterium]|nr:tRNA uridine-5-carboxymethylaminomethyl(34) synthesis GTPase MnmE [bacterium]MDT8366997.1 tRNA uridine-5-carboxymethylaminomethyl(34) synthesis GTPase MnmE [bacterium]
MKDDPGIKEITSSAHDVHDTVTAISTPPGPGGIGMVRITGPDAIGVGRRIFTHPGAGSPLDPEPKKAVVGHVHYPGFPEEPIDQAVWLFFKGPNSFTGEDTVEITAHGGPLIMGNLLEAATLAGARLAEPGEFTRRAFYNGRIDLSQAEAVASLIFASTEEALRVMQRQVAGAMGKEAQQLREGLLEVKVLLESAIDFPEDVDDIQPGILVPPINVIMERVEGLLDTAREGIAMAEGLKVVIAGAPNVGKSSLLNALLQQDRAIVHEAAGTTRDFIEGRVSVKGIPMVVVDTAGIRGEADLLEREGITRTKNLMKGADLLLVVIDGSRPMSSDEQQLLQETTHTRRVVAVNKCDLSRHPELEEPQGAVNISAVTGEGIDALKEAIHDTCTGGGQALNEVDGVVTSLRQAEALKKVREGCSRLMEGIRESREPELLAVDLQEALLGVGELTGELTVDEVLDEIFSRFCIGK